MKLSVLYGVLMFVFWIPVNYLGAYMGFLEHRSFTHILVQSAITAFLFAIYMHFFMAWLERRKARKTGSDN